MPELPEVETAVRALRAPLVGRTILSAHFPEPPRRMLNLPADVFAARVSGERIQALTRRAKYLIFQLSTQSMIVHLKMTGHLYVLPRGQADEMDRWLRVCLLLDNEAELRFSDARRFGRVYLAAQPEDVLPPLGPEPLDDSFTPAMFAERLRKRKGVLKSLLLDQAFIAGIGNIYADEALHIAGLHPLRRAESLSAAEVEQLYHGVRQALNDGLARMGASIGWYRQPNGARGEAQNYLRAYRGRGDARPCPVCGTPIHTIRIGQRSAHFCPTCQPLL
ncbi:MAG: bifunctional DNA-formamidopyrimidine glycosylase/DNA-(apurinic or apyrimidinic site) lyase [Anaerolineae bacterium]|nr:bifunctional DNA-formamidopyrimidine glycosylase/DNA-(apurinic or apyrimidinic site) lyase [Anaerolineae bacterium]